MNVYIGVLFVQIMLQERLVSMRKIPTRKVPTTTTIYPEYGARNNLTTMFETYMALLAMLHNANINRNTVTVPLTVRLGLCKLASVALGQAKTQLLRAFEIVKKNNFMYCYTEVEPLLTEVRYMDVLMVNKIYVSNSKDIDPSFIANSTQKYGVHVEQVDFQRPELVANYINRWIESATYKRVRDVMDKRDVTNETSILLVSAIHIKCTWDFPFRLDQTKTMKFKGPFKTSDVPMMTRSDWFLHFSDTKNKFQILQTNLQTNGMMITFILPERKDMVPVLLERFTRYPRLLTDAKHQMMMAPAVLTLPRFKIKSNLDYTDVVKACGVVQIFNRTCSGLESMLQSHKDLKSVYLSRIKQKVFIEIDELGVARNPYVVQHPEFLPTPPVLESKKHEFKATHPFIFSVDIVLSHLGHHTELVMGAYYGPD